MELQEPTTRKTRFLAVMVGAPFHLLGAALLIVSFHQLTNKGEPLAALILAILGILILFHGLTCWFGASGIRMDSTAQAFVCWSTLGPWTFSRKSLPYASLFEIAVCDGRARHYHPSLYSVEVSGDTQTLRVESFRSFDAAEALLQKIQEETGYVIAQRSLRREL